MINRSITLASLFALSLLTGCANSDYFEPGSLHNPANAMVYIYRPGGTNPGKKPLITSYPEIQVDGIGHGMLKYKKYLALELSPGKREFVATGLTPDARWEPKDRKYTLNIEPGKSYFLRLRVEYDTDHMTIGSFRGQYLIHLHAVEESEAVYEIRHLNDGGD